MVKIERQVAPSPKPKTERSSGSPKPRFDAKAVRSAVRPEVAADKVTLSSKAADSNQVASLAAAPKSDSRLGGKDDPRAQDSKVYKANNEQAKVHRPK